MPFTRIRPALQADAIRELLDGQTGYL